MNNRLVRIFINTFIKTTETFLIIKNDEIIFEGNIDNLIYDSEPYILNLNVVHVTSKDDKICIVCI